MSRSANLGDIFGTPDGQVVRVTRVGTIGQPLGCVVVVIGGARDGEVRRMPRGIPDDWSRYPR